MTQYVSLLYSYNYLPVLLRPTRVSSTSATMLDHIWTNDLSFVQNSGIVMSNISDHFAVFCEYRGNIFTNGVDYINVKRRLCTQANKDRLAQAISEYDWSSILTVNDVEDANATFASALQSLYNEHCPLKTICN